MRIAVFAAVLAFSALARAEDGAITIPRTELGFETAAREAVLAPQRGKGAVLLQLSSWAPKDFSAPSRIAGTEGYKRQKMPELSVGWASGGNLCVRTGLSYSRMERRIDQSTVIAGGHSTQSLHLLPVKVGLEWHPQRMESASLSPYVGLSLLPTITIAEDSAAGGSGWQFGLPGEAIAGTAIALPVKAMSVDVSVLLRGGKVEELDLFGFGAQAGVRYSL